VTEVLPAAEASSAGEETTGGGLAAGRRCEEEVEGECGVALRGTGSVPGLLALI